MKRKDIVVGEVYLVLVSDKLSPVIIKSLDSIIGWHGCNLATKKDVRIKTAAKCRKKLTPEQVETMLVSRRNAGA